MKINRLETHDRLEHFKKDQSLNIAQGAEDCLKKNYLSTCLQQYSPYIYVWAHPRTHDDGVTKVMYWQPRLTKPIPQTNSYCFRVESNTDLLETIWLLPPEETWPQYQKGNVTEHEMVLWSIDQFTKNFEELAKPYPDDLPEEQIKAIYLRIGAETDQQTMMDKLYVPEIGLPVK